jgi:hypothetical protein
MEIGPCAIHGTVKPLPPRWGKELYREDAGNAFIENLPAIFAERFSGLPAYRSA